jgi:hypothetical protein
MSIKPDKVHLYHVFLASPGDVSAERQHVRRFFDDYNRHTAHLWNAEFRVVDWENYATIGVGRPQELITQQTLEKYKESLAALYGSGAYGELPYEPCMLSQHTSLVFFCSLRFTFVPRLTGLHSVRVLRKIESTERGMTTCQPHTIRISHTR